MVIFAGIAALCLGTLIVRYLREKKCHSECPNCPSEPSPATLKITVSYCPGSVENVSEVSINKISENALQQLHEKFVDNDVSYTNNARV